MGRELCFVGQHLVDDMERAFCAVYRPIVRWCFDLCYVVSVPIKTKIDAGYFMKVMINLCLFGPAWTANVAIKIC